MRPKLDVMSRVQQVIESSELLQVVASVRKDSGRKLALGPAEVRPLSRPEIEQLERNGNWSENWARVGVSHPFDPARVRQSSFHGDVLLGRFAGSAETGDGRTVPTGIYRSTVADSVVGDDVLVHDVRWLSGQVVCPGAVLWDCGRITCTAPTTFGNGSLLAIGIEVGGRSVAIFAEIDIDVAAAIANVSSSGELQNWYARVVTDYKNAVTSPRSIISRAALVRSVPHLHNSFLGAGAVVDGATLVTDSTLLCSPEEPVRIESGSCVHSSILQWGSRVSTMAIVDHSVLTEYGSVERHGKLFSSILGPNAGVAEGEVTASLLGPFVGFHHQSLLIAALWPEGKGNIAYGANVGSNHTSRAPDQEFWPGEGAYLGLGVNIKYPSDFRKAPYTIVAMGVSTLPQRLGFPFSLLNEPRVPYPGISPAYNEIIPAWVLTDNLYMLRRNEAKYRQRNRARRTQFEFAVFRPEIVDGMREACRRLEGVTEVKGAYTDRDIEGLGKNFMLEEHRRPAIEAYRFHIAHYALMGLKERLGALLARDHRQEVASLLDQASELDPWEHQRRLLVDELRVTDLQSALQQLLGMVEKVAQDVERSKAKDDRRGQRIMEDYTAAHVLAPQDAFVLETWKQTRRLTAEIGELLAKL